MHFLVTMAIMIAVSIGVSMLMRKDPKMGPGAKPGKIDVPIAEEGVSIPVLFGTLRIKGPNVVWYGDIETKAIRK